MSIIDKVYNAIIIIVAIVIVVAAESFTVVLLSGSKSAKWHWDTNIGSPISDLVL